MGKVCTCAKRESLDSERTCLQNLLSSLDRGSLASLGKFERNSSLMLFASSVVDPNKRENMFRWGWVAVRGGKEDRSRHEDLYSCRHMESSSFYSFILSMEL